MRDKKTLCGFDFYLSSDGIAGYEPEYAVYGMQAVKYAIYIVKYKYYVV